MAAVALGQPSPSFRLTSADLAAKIPIDVIANGLVFFQAEVNDQPGWFILDDASQGFTVDQEFARRVLPKTTESASARGGGPAVIEAGIIRDVQISLPGLNLTHRVLIAIDLKAIEPSIGHTVDGIVGSRLFDDFVVAVDFEHHLLSVYQPDLFRPPAAATALDVRIDSHGFPFIDATISLPGVAPVTGSFLLDSGANTYADLYQPFSDQHHLPPPSMKTFDEPGTSTGGTTQSRDGRADRIAIGPYSVDDPPITFARDVEGLMASKDYAGLIGAEFLERFSVVFDNPHNASG